MAHYLSESLHKDTDRYLLSLMSPPDGVLARMEEYALTRNFPFVGPLVGQLLSILGRACNAKQVFELGSGFGYSAVHFARVLPEDGRVYCTDNDEQNRKMAEGYFADAGIGHKIEFHVGDAVQILNRFDGPFDIIFMDIDKEGYPDGFRAAWPKLRVGGLFIADNLYWHKLAFGDDQTESTRGIREFTNLIFNQPNGKSSIIPLRDGISITLKTE
jgi:caffeoyl-CoA O-methyltransferase